MGSLQKQRGSATRTNSSPSCLRFGSFGVLLVPIGLLSVSFALDIYGSRLAAGLVPTISIALTCAVCLAVSPHGISSTSTGERTKPFVTRTANSRRFSRTCLTEF